MTSKSMTLTAACLLAGSTFSWQAPAIAGSDNSGDTYAGDYAGGSLPIGTFIALQYAGFAHSNAFVDTTGNQVLNSHANVWEEFTRFSYCTQLGVSDTEAPFATLTKASIPGFPNNEVAGGFADPVVHLNYFLISDAQTQRWLGLTDYLYMPFRNYDNTKLINVATAHQFADVPQIGYIEGLGKFSPALKGFFFDLIANASIHSDGNSPLNFTNTPTILGPGTLTYDKITQSTSYDVKAFLRYEPMTFAFIALGIERSFSFRSRLQGKGLLSASISCGQF